MSLELEIKERFRFYKLSWEEKSRVLEKLREEISKHEEILLAVVYGSFLKNYPFRDIDIAVYVKGEVDSLNYKFTLDEELTEKLSYPIDTRVLNDAPPWFTRKVLMKGKVIVEKIPLLLERLLLKAIDEEQHLRENTSY